MWNSVDSSFKKLINRVSTDSNKKYYEEFGDNTLNIVNSEIWSTSPVFDDPAGAVSNSIAQAYTLLALTEDITVSGQQSYYAGPAFNARLKNWISPKFGNAYTIKLYDNLSSEIDATNAVDWIFDYQTGILTLNGNTSGFSKPFRISGWRYTGSFGAGSSGNLYLEEIYTNQTSVIINHNWNTKPVVIILDANDEIISGDVDYTNSNTVTISFFSGQSGTIILQSGLPSAIPISDAQFDSSWNGVSGIAPSKNSVYDALNSINPINSNTAYVNDTYGNDSTGIVGLMSHKYKTINAANLSTATTIIIEEGTYIEIGVFKGSKTYKCDLNVNINSAGSITSPNFGGKVYGYGNFILLNANNSLFENLSSCYIEFENLVAAYGPKPLITALDGSIINLVGNVTQNKAKALCILGYEGLFGYPTTGTDISIYSTNIFYSSGINSAAICPFNRPNLDFRFYNCVLKSVGTNSNIFGRYSTNAVGIKMVLNNCNLISTATTASSDSLGAHQYSYIDNNTYSNKPLDVNTQSYQGSVIVNANIVNIY